MKIVNDNLKKSLKQPTTQRKGKILINDKYYEVYNVEYYADVYNDGNVIGNAIASQLDFDLPYIAKFDSFKYFDGVWTGRDYEFVDMGTFTVVDEKDEDEFNKHITSFDNLIKFNAPFEDKKDYPKTLFQELQNICSQAGVELVNTSIVNGSFIVENNQFVAGENLKTVLKNICGVSGTYATIKNDKLVLQLQNKTNEVMNKGQHEPIEWKRKTYGINQVVLGLKDVGGEYVVKQDDEDITKNGVHKLVINDNYFAYTQEKRQQLINGLFEQVKGFGYVPYELKGEWLNYMDVGDTITIDGIETIVLRINGKSPKGLESIMSSPAIIDSAIEYVDNTNTLANQQRRTELLVDKELGEIRGEVSKVETTVENITTTTQISTGGNSLHITDSLESNALEYHIEGKSEQETRSGKNLFDYKKIAVNISLLIKNYCNVIAIDNGFTINSTGVDAYFALGSANAKETTTHKISPNTTYTLSYSVSEDIPIPKYIVYYDSNFNVVQDYSYIYTNNPYTFTTPANAEYCFIRFGLVNQVGKTVNITNIMLEEGSVATEYEQFGASPSPDYPSEIKTIKGIENLFDKDDVFLNKQWNGSTLSESEVANASPKIPVIGGKKYKRNVGYNANIFIKNDGSVVDIQGATNTIVAPENSKYWVFNIPKEVDLNTVMAVQGDTISDYVPYGAWAKVKVNGKNIFNGKLENGSFNISTGLPISSTAVRRNVNIIPVQPNTTYVISKNSTKINVRYFYYDKDKNFISTIVLSGAFTTPSNCYYINFISDAISLSDKLQLEKGTKATEYEAYKEKEVLIDLNKPNLFDKDNVNKFSGYLPSESGNLLGTNSSAVLVYIPCEGKKQYTVKKGVSDRFIVGTTQVLPANGVVGNDIIRDDSKTELTIITSANAKYLCVYYSATGQNIDDSIEIYEGYSPYYELSSIGDTKDELNIIDGQVVINKKIDKSILNGSETWNLDNSTDTRITFSHPGKIYIGQLISSHFGYKTSGAVPKIVNDTNGTLYATVYKTTASNIATFKTWLSNNNPEVYYKLSTPQQIVLPNVNIPLFEGVNHISLVEDVETNTSIKYLRKTSISGEYATNQQLGETNYNLANTTSKTNENTLNLNATNTNLNNNYYTKPQIDIMNTATTEEITTIKKEVETKITAEDLTIAINQIKTTGATSVETTTGYKFNEEGLSIQKSDSEMSSLLDNDGLVVKRNDTEMLTVRSSGVEAENITVRTYFTIGNNTRAENYKGGTGFFYIGGDD